MKNIEFAEKYGVFYNIVEGKNKIIDLFDYQKDMLIDFGVTNYLAIQHSRQVGVSTMLIIHVANFLLNNTSENRILIFKSNSNKSQHAFISKVRGLLDKYFNSINYNDIGYQINNSGNITLSNGNTILAMKDNIKQTLDNPNIIYSEVNINTIIVDDACWIKDNDFIKLIDYISVNQIKTIIVSAKRKEKNYFYNTIFRNHKNVFKSYSIPWDARFNQTWYDDIVRNMDPETIMCEIDLIDLPYDENKNRVITVRLNDKLISMISDKLIKNDVSLSEYIRYLIEKDNS